MNIGKRLEKARKAIGFTQRQVSQLSGISPPSLSDYENNNREPKFSQLAKLADIYKKSVEFFLSDEEIQEPIMLFREEPETDEEKKKIKAEFEQLCEQYHKLELLFNEKPKYKLPEYELKDKEFDFGDANDLAESFQSMYLPCDVPSALLKKTLEENFFVKIFHLGFSGSAISTISDKYGPAILLSSLSKEWRRNYDLAHELFHILTWKHFRKEDGTLNDYEEKLANAFASRLLLPTNQVKSRIEKSTDRNGKISLENLDEIAREFGVSLDALLWRMLYLYNKTQEEIEQYLEKAKIVKFTRPSRESDKPDTLPERYCSLAIRALNEGRLSLMQFAKYMKISYKKAQEYLIEVEDFTDEKVAIPVA